MQVDQNKDTIRQPAITYFPSDNQPPAFNLRNLRIIKVFNSNPDSNLRVGSTQLIERLKPSICMRKY